MNKFLLAYILLLIVVYFNSKPLDVAKKEQEKVEQQ